MIWIFQKYLFKSFLCIKLIHYVQSIYFTIFTFCFNYTHSNANSKQNQIPFLFAELTTHLKWNVIVLSPQVQLIFFKLFILKITKSDMNCYGNPHLKCLFAHFMRKSPLSPFMNIPKFFCSSFPVAWLERNAISQAFEDSSPAFSWVRLVDFRIISCLFVCDLQHPHPSLIDFPLIFASRRLISFHFNILSRYRKQIPQNTSKRRGIKWNEMIECTKSFIFQSFLFIDLDNYDWEGG